MIWLMYLVFLFVDPFIAKRNQPLVWVGTVLAAAGFITLYLQTYSARGLRAGLRIFGMVLLGVVCLPWNSGALSFFIYAAAALPWMSKGTKLWASLLAIVATILLQAHLLHFPTFVPFQMAILAAGTCAANYHFAQKKLTDKKLQLAQDEVEHLAKIAERERIARDMHDLLGHTLSLITLKAELARKLVDRDPQRARQEILEVEQTSRTALAGVREAISGFRGQGLAAEVIRSRKTLDAAGIEVEANVAELPLTTAQETVLTLALREATTNIVRHSQAQRCRIQMGLENEVCTLEIADNGRGGGESEGNGLRGMRERLEAIGGSLQRRTETGTRLIICLPIAEAASAVRN